MGTSRQTCPLATDVCPCSRLQLRIFRSNGTNGRSLGKWLNLTSRSNMIVKKLDTWHLKLGFLSPIKHNLATHEGSDNIVLGVTTGGAITGFGEGVPRAFVTGEVLSDSLVFLHQVLAPAILTRDFPSPGALVKALGDLYQHVQAQRHPAAF